MDYFKKLADLLKTEKIEDQAQYKRLTETASIGEKRTNGLTWYPIAIRGQELGRGDYLTVEVERTTHQDLPHQFRFGIPAVIFSNHDPKVDRVEGIINHQSGNRAKITLRTDELPDWSRDGKLGLEILFDNNSYEEMESAIKKAQDYKNADVLTGISKPVFEENFEKIKIQKLNNSQNQAVNNIISAKQLSIVHGPPGTGKTTTIVAAITEMASKNQKILVTAPSNAAVDLLAEKLSEKGLEVLRVGNPVRVSERLNKLTLDAKISQHPAFKDIKKLKIQANEYRNLAHKYKRNFGKAERDQRKALFDEAHKILKEIENIEEYILDDLRGKTQVVAATLVGANHYTVSKNQYDVVIIDEAGQALEPACWIPILKAEKVVLAGDHCQLPPTIKSELAAQQGLSVTLLEKLVNTHPEAVTLLDTQYRMNEKIMAHSSKEFYGNRLIAHESVKNQVLNQEIPPLLYIDTAGCSFDEKIEGTSATNPEEAAFVVKRMEELSKYFDNKTSVAVISPYKQQIKILEELVNASETLKTFIANISINTIDSFQGQERDAVFISMTRSNSENLIGFLADTRRMNVAMTRARKLLVVVGDSATIGSHPFYAGFIENSEKTEAYKSAWEFLNL